MNIRHLKQRARRFVWLLLVLALTVTAFPRQAAAEDGGQAFSISPPLIELKADPGQTVNATIKFTNISAGELLIKTQFNDFSAKNETGEPNIIFDDNQSTSYSLKNWIGAPAPFKIASKETKTLTFPITVPKDAEPGGHYAVIRFTGTAPDLEESGVSLSASIGTLVLLQVSGNIKEDAFLVEFNSATAAPELAVASFFEGGPVSFTERIRNSGNVHVKPTGTIEIFNMFGAKVDTLRVNGDPTDPKNQPKSILPKSVRRFDQTMSNQWMFGPYTAKLTLSYGQGQKQLTSSITFWVIPYKLILIILLSAVAVFFLVRQGLRRYKARIIAQANGSSSFGGKPLKKMKRK